MLLSLFCNTLPTLSRKNSVSGVWQWTSQSMQRPAQAPESDPILLAKRKCQAASSAVRPVFGVLASGYAAVEMLMGSWWLLPMNNAPRAGAYLFRGFGLKVVDVVRMAAFCAPESDPILLAKRKCQAASSAVRPVFGVLASGYAAVEMLMGSWWLLPMNNAPRAGCPEKA
ncbi:hypothetical protein AK812_SmicGene29186 [Symbiodinium microadriaticum]|uniref:Uncharacterized protein n=1 Tax=Symbiodinium microadriaticum TaxID=2951 RepID=A0A1Q9D2E8_SYMMI|nr:hypothetical protein AK812_SmicGene29186 [Symbiodinium microadriaticum]